MIVYTIFRLIWNQTRYDKDDGSKIKNGLGIERDVLRYAGKRVVGGGRWRELEGGESC